MMLMGYPTYDQVRLAPWKQLFQNFPLGNEPTDVTIQNARLSTATVGGAAIELGASYTYGEFWEIKTKVTSWTGIGNSFIGYYFRTETGVASTGKGLRTMEIYAVNNATYSLGNLQGIYVEAAMKASGTQTLTGGNAAEFALAPYGGTGAITITNYWDCVLLTPSGVSTRIDATNAAKINGIHLLARDGDGGSTKLGDGFKMENDSGQAGTRTLTNGINIAIGCTTGVLISGATTTGLSITGAATTAINVSGGGVIYAAKTETSATPSSTRLFYAKHTTYSSMTSGTLCAVRGEINLAGNVSASYLYGVQGKLITNNKSLTTGSSHYCGVMAQMDVSSGTLTSGHIACIIASIQDTGNATALNMDGIYVELPTYGSGSTTNAVLRANGGTECIIDASATNGNDQVFANLPAAGTGCVQADAAGSSGNSYIKVSIGGVPHTIVAAHG